VEKRISFLMSLSVRAAGPTRRLALTFVCLAAVVCEVSGIGIHVHISTPHISVPHLNVGPIALTPIGPIPAPALKPIQNTVNAATHAVGTVVGGAATITGNAVQSATAPPLQVFGVIAGKESLGTAAGNIAKGPGVVIASVGQAVTETNAAVISVPVVAAQSIAGDAGKTVLTIVTGPTRLTVDFTATAVIQAGGILQGDNPAMLIAEPLAAALRSAEHQFESQAQPLPADVKARLSGFYPVDILNSARWTVGSVSLSVPDLINNERKLFAGVDNAVTVGHITVFETDPGNNYHWWAHEMQHHVQYANWGIDQFALHYVTFCHQVETDAETKAQQVFPQLFPTPLSC
jgi:hypothetical protein